MMQALYFYAGSILLRAWHTTNYLLDLLAVQIIHILIHDDEAPRPNFI